MTGADLALALAAGLVAAVNPCGFALLPAYLSLLVLDGTVGRRQAVARALGLTAAMTAGFALVFGIFGLAIAPVAGSIAEHLPWVTIVVGVVLVGLGGWLLAGRQIAGLVPRLGRGPDVTRSAVSMVLFGAAYAVASLGCTIGPFLAVVATSFTAGDVGAGTALFLAYAGAMGLLVGTLSLAVALARTALVARLRRAAAAVNRVAGGLMVVAGAYVAYYGWYEIRVFRGDVGADPVVEAAGRVQSAVSGWLQGLGVLRIAVVCGLLLVAATVAVAVARRVRR